MTLVNLLDPRLGVPSSDVMRELARRERLTEAERQAEDQARLEAEREEKRGPKAA